MQAIANDLSMQTVTWVKSYLTCLSKQLRCLLPLEGITLDDFE